MSSSVPSQEIPPLHVASHDVYLASLDRQFMGADFSADLYGNIRMNGAVALARDIVFDGHTDREAEQVVRNICTYTARRIELGVATTENPRFLTGAFKVGSTHAVQEHELEIIGVEPSQGWVGIRKNMARLLLENLETFDESLADSGGREERTRENIAKWKPIVDQILFETRQEVLVTSGPRLLPGVEVIGFPQNPTT